MKLNNSSAWVFRRALAAIGFFAVMYLAGSSTLAQVSFDLSSYPTSAPTEAVARIDFDGDGLEDVAMAEGWWIEILRNLGDGSYQRTWAFDAGNFNFGGLSAIDLDGDRFMDLVWGGRGYVFGYDPDFHTLRNTGTGTFTHTAYPLANRPRDIEPADMDGDGDVDLVILDSGGSRDYEEVHIWLNDNGMFVDSSTLVLGSSNASRDLTVGDFDQDGDLDVAAASAYVRYSDSCDCDIVGGATVWRLSNDGVANLTIASEVPLPDVQIGDGYFPSSIQTGDLDGDGDLDLAVTVGPYEITNDSGVVLLENTDGDFATIELPRIPSTIHAPQLDLTDVNLDGRLDVLLAIGKRNKPGEMSLYLNQGGFQFSGRESIDVGAGEFPHDLLAASLASTGQMGFIVGDDWGVSLFTNTTPVTGPTLTLSDLRRGQPATIRIDGAAPGEPVHILYSLVGYGPSLGLAPLGGMCIDLAGDFALLATVRANSQGVATWNGTTPTHAPQRTVHFQAVMRRGPGGIQSVKTPIARDRIDP